MPHKATTTIGRKPVSTPRTDDDPDDLDPIFAVMRCCASTIQISSGKHARKSRIDQIPPGEHHPDRADNISGICLPRKISTIRTVQGVID